jgi:hypothetical protein
MLRGVRLASALLLGSALTLVLLLGAISIAVAQEQPAGVAAPTALRVNELMASNGSTLVDPADPDRTPDWIEIYNTSDVVVSLQGLAVSDDPSRPNKHIITASLTIPAKGFLILYADNAPQRGPQHLDFALSRQGESFGIYQLDNAGNAVAIDEVTFPELGRDVAYARSIDGGGVWRVARPTPGKSNTINPPWISQVTAPNVNPDQPAPTDPFTVSAVITDDVGVAAANLFYMTATAPFTNLAASWTPIPMTAIGADRYEAVIPGTAPGTLVRYYVEASDDAGDSTRFPTLPGRAYAFLSGYQPPRLLLNKVVSRNDIVPDPDEPGEYPDWVEVYNPGNIPVSMDGLSITNRRSQPLLFSLPQGIVVPARGLLTLLIDGDVGQNLSRGSDLIWHVGSGNVMNRLENNGDYVGIFGGQGTIVIDEFDWDERPRWGAFGRVPVGGEWSDRVCVIEMNAPNLLCDQEIFLPSVQR